MHPVVILGNSRRRPEEISEFIELYPDKGDQCGSEIKPYEKGFDGLWRKVFEDLAKAKERAISRMVELLLLPIEHKDTRRVRRRIIKYNQELFTFLDNPLLRQPIIALERQLRPKVIMRKITFGNRSSSGASNHENDDEDAGCALRKPVAYPEPTFRLKMLIAH